MEPYLDDMILDSLTDLKWSPKPLGSSSLDSLTGDWINFSDLITWITTELKSVTPELEETVTSIKSVSELPEFCMELSSLLKELGCTLDLLMGPPLSDRFDTPLSKKSVIYFLLSELESARMLHLETKTSKTLKVDLAESDTARTLREVCMELGLGKPSESTTVQSVWSVLLGKIKSNSSGMGALEPLFSGDLSPNQWVLLENYFSELKSDYRMRREMLLKRLDVTVQSFHWSDRLRGKKEEEINEKFRTFRPYMSTEPGVALSDVLAARADLAVVEKTSSTSVRKNTKSAVNSVMIGRVPDRGGRPNEVEPPPPEMPSWQQRQAGPSGTSGWIQNPNQRGRGGGRGGPRGGRVQGGWSNQGQSRGGGGEGGSQYQQNNTSYYKGGGYNNQQPQQDFQNQSYGGYQQEQNYGGGGTKYYQQDGGNRGSYHQHDVRDDNNYQGQSYQQHGYNDRGQGQGHGHNQRSRGGGGRGSYRGRY